MIDDFARLIVISLALSICLVCQSFLYTLPSPGGAVLLVSTARVSVPNSFIPSVSDVMAHATMKDH